MEQEQTVSLKGFFLVALLWMPLAFFFWFQWAGLFVAPVGFISEWLLSLALGDQLRGVEAVQHLMVVEVYFAPPEGTQIKLDSMIYGYGLPLLAGLAISTPNAIWVRALQIVAGWLLVCLIQSWGIFWETLWQLQSYAGPEGVELARSTGIAEAVVYQAYQFGVLILPGILPAALWIVMNRRFLEAVIGGRLGKRETPREDGGQLD